MSRTLRGSLVVVVAVSLLLGVCASSAWAAPSIWFTQPVDDLVAPGTAVTVQTDLPGDLVVTILLDGNIVETFHGSMTYSVTLSQSELTLGEHTLTATAANGTRSSP